MAPHTRLNAAPWGLAFLLLLANTLSFVDRMLLTLLVAPIRAELQISDTQISLLQGMAFAVFYALVGLPLGRLADRSDRPRLIAGGMGLWSAMTAASGAALSYSWLFLARVGVAVGEAALSPAAVSLLSERFARPLLSRAIGVFQSGIFIGTGIALLVGGSLLGWLQHFDPARLGLPAGMAAWRLVFFIVGLPGLLVAAMVLFIDEPRRRLGLQQTGVDHSFSATLAYLRQHRSLYGWHFLAFTAITIIGYGTLSWMPTVLVRSHHVTTAFAGRSLGSIMLIAGPLGVLASAWLLDVLVRRNLPDGPIRAAIFSVVLLALALPLYCLTDTVESALAAATLLAFAQSFPYGIAAASLALVTPARLRGQVTAVYLLISNLLGLSLGPLIVALLTDRYFGYDGAVRYSLALLPVLTAPIALLGLLLCRRAYSQAWRGVLANT